MFAWKIVCNTATMLFGSSSHRSDSDVSSSIQSRKSVLRDVTVPRSMAMRLPSSACVPKKIVKSSKNLPIAENLCVHKLWGITGTRLVFFLGFDRMFLRLSECCKDWATWQQPRCTLYTGKSSILFTMRVVYSCLPCI